MARRAARHGDRRDPGRAAGRRPDARRLLGLYAGEEDLPYAADVRQGRRRGRGGKVGVPDAVLQKPGPLEDNEWTLIKLHPSIGANLLDHRSSPLLKMAREIALGHHENWDGSGYPMALRGSNIPQSARLVHLVDVYDALAAHALIKNGFTPPALSRSSPGAMDALSRSILSRC